MQPPLLARERRPILHAAVASLALGGAERIVLDWAARTVRHASRAHAVRIAVLRDTKPEWPIPPGVALIRFHGVAIEARLAIFGAQAAADGSPVVSCHLLTQGQRRALRSGGAATVPVLHNAQDGWLEPASSLVDEHFTIAVSRATAGEYLESGGRIPCTVVRHLPRQPRFGAGAREHWRERWAIPVDAQVIGMTGAVKPQKAYPRALRILRKILDQDDIRSEDARPVYLVILGGPIGRDGDLAWNAVLEQAHHLGVTEYVRLPGFVPEAALCLPAFDVFLNTSRYEGLSMATLEALAAGLPVVASRVGGQGEVGATGLSLLAFDAPDAEWAAALKMHGVPARSVASKPAPEPSMETTQPPAWVGFPSERLWTMGHLARPFMPAGRRVLLVTANLNAGGAQRSLVNLALALKGRLDFEIAVTGNSTSSTFAEKLASAGVRHFRSAGTHDCLDHAEALITHIANTAPSCVCFWNVDAKIKLLLAKWLEHSALKFIDVSPGAYLFEEMAATRDFQECIAYTDTEYYRRLDRLVHKYHAAPMGQLAGKSTIIANGVPAAQLGVADRTESRTHPVKIAICGRIAPSKFLLEAIESMRLLWRHVPGAQLHVIGTAEPRHRDYALRVTAAAGQETLNGARARVVFHGPAFDAPDQLATYDTLLVLGRHQGCPNVILEALALGVPVLANDSGGTRELVIHEKTGLLLDGIDPAAIAASLRRLIEHPEFARKLSARGKTHVRKHFSIERMRDRYLHLFR